MAEPKFWLVVDENDEDASFAARGNIPRYLAMKAMAASNSKNESKQVEALFTLIEAILDEGEFERFDEYMIKTDNVDALGPAISRYFEDLTGRPTEQPVSSTGHSTTPAPVPSSRVVSFSKGTVEAADPEMNSSTA